MKTVDDVRDCLKQIKLVIPTPRDTNVQLAARQGGLERSLEQVLLLCPGQPCLAVCLKLHTAARHHCLLLTTVQHLYAKPPKARCLGREGDTTTARKVCNLVSRRQVYWK